MNALRESNAPILSPEGALCCGVARLFKQGTPLCKNNQTHQLINFDKEPAPLPLHLMASEAYGVAERPVCIPNGCHSLP